MKKIKNKLNRIKKLRIKLTAILYGFLGVFILGFISYFLFFFLGDTKKIDEILPGENLLFFSEFSKKAFFEEIQTNQLIQNQFLATLENFFQNPPEELVKLKKNLELWPGDKMAFALFQTKTSTEKELNQRYYLLIENRDEKVALKRLHDLNPQQEKINFTKYRKIDLLSFGTKKELNCAFLYGYFICSNEIEGIEDLIAINRLETENIKVENLPLYQKVKNNLPHFADGHFYLDVQKFNFEKLDFYLGTLKDYLQAGGLTFRRDESGLHLNSYLSLKKGLVNSGTTVLTNNLAENTAAQDVSLFLSGGNLTSSVEQVLKIWDKSMPYFSIIIEGMIRTRIAHYFGDTVSLEEDFYPLLEHNYALAFYLSPKNLSPQFSLVLQVKDTKTATEIVEKIFAGFYEKSGQYVPQVKEVTLQDGTIIRELVADSSKVIKKEKLLEGVTLHYLELEGKTSGFAYAVDSDKIFLASSLETLSKALEVKKNTTQAFAQTKEYKTISEGLFLRGNELTYLNTDSFQKLLKFYNLDLPSLNLLSLSHFLIYSTKWFDDGVSSELILF